MKKIIVLVLLIMGCISTVFGSERPTIGARELFLKAEQDLGIYQAAKDEAIRQNLPISIYLPEGIYIQALGIENHKVVYGVVTNMAHPLLNTRTAFFEEISQSYDLSQARIVYGKGVVVNESVGMPIPKETLQRSLLLIPESTADRVLAFDPVTGDLVDDNFIPSSTGPLSTPICVQQTPWGNLTISDQITDLVQEFDTSGVYLGIFAPAGGVNNAILDNIRAHAFRSNGNLVVAVGGGANDDAIAEFDQSGNYLGNFIANGSGGLNSPWDIFFRTNDVLVSGGSSNAIHSYDLNGSYLSNFGTTVTFPEQIAELQNGNIAVAGFSTPSGVYIFSSTGAYITTFTGVTGNRGVWELGNGNLLTTNGSGVHEIDGTTGALVRTIVPGISARFISRYEETPLQHNKILISEFVVTPTNGEFIEIYNPNSFPVDLSNYYITDATFASSGTYYYNIVTGINAGGGTFTDFNARFPNGASINPGEYQTIAMHGTNFSTYYGGVLPTYELFDTNPAIPDMREALPGSIANQGGLTNSDEVIILYYWDGLSDLVADVDYVLYNSASPTPNDEAVDKTGVRRDGPDADSDSSQYLPDTPVASQVSAINSGVGFSSHRIDFFEGNQISSGGNGVTGSDETSEDLHNTFTNNSIPSPNAPWVPASTARVQIIHNAADPAAEFVDIYLNGFLIVDDFAFRTATRFLDLPAGILLNLGIAPGNSTSVADTIKNFSVDFVQGGKYIGIATGVLNPTSFAPNPDGLDIAFTIVGQDTARETSSTPGSVEFFFMHGVTDAPTVDLAIRSVGTIFENVSYGSVTNYHTVLPAVYTFDVMDSSGTQRYTTFEADFSGLADSALVIFVSGFLEPSLNQNGPGVGFFTALPNGTVSQLPEISGPTVEFFDDFESGTSNWILTGSWGLTTSQFYSPTHSLTESPVGNYAPNLNITATMANGVDLTNALDATVSFYARYNIELGFDYMYLEGSVDNTNWIQLAVFDGEGFNTFQQYSFSLGGFVGNPDVKLRFRFTSDVGYEVDGMYIDDFMITSSDEDNTPPLIVHEGPTFYEGTLENFPVEAEIIDISGVALTNLLYTLDSGSLNTIAPDSSAGNRYYFTIPAQPAGTNVDYWITATDSAANTDTVGNFSYIAGNHLIYDNGEVTYVAQFLSGTGCAVRISIPAGKQANLAAILLRNYTDINRPNDPMLVHVWANNNGLPGQDVIPPFLVMPEATLTNTSPMTRVDLRPYSSQLSGLSGDYFIGFTVPTGSVNGVWITQTTPGLFGRTFNFNGSSWSADTDDYHFRAIIGDTIATGISATDMIPNEFRLGQNYPNPFNPTTTIKYALKENVQVTLKIYNLLGQEVRTLVNGWQEAGYKQVVWDGLNNYGSPVASGIYIYQIQAGSFVQARKMILMK